MSINQLSHALERRRSAEEVVAATLKRQYPVGGGIKWERNGIHFGEVVQHSGHDRIKVRNKRTGNELWIYATAISE